MNGESIDKNGLHAPNGQSNMVSDIKVIKSESDSQYGATSTISQSQPHINGFSHQDDLNEDNYKMTNGFDQAPLEVLQLIDKEKYLPLATLIKRSAQNCWNGLSGLVDQLANISIPQQTAEQNGNSINNQTKANLDKKDRILKFASDQKADFIKLLVLLQWSKDVDDVTKTIELNFWLMGRRIAYWDVIRSMAILKQDAIGFQIPNPDIQTAGEILSLKKAPLLSSLKEYQPQKSLSNKQILRTLKTLNHLLSIKLTLLGNLPAQFRNYHVHDGRVTFIVPDEFELDLSIVDESPNSPFRIVDFRFLFSPAPKITDPLRNEIDRLTNLNIDRDDLVGCYNFFHDLTLSYKVNEFHKQASELARSQWSGNLRVELIRRTLVVQYWTTRSLAKSWIELGIISGRTSINQQFSQPSLHLRWVPESNHVEDIQIDMSLASLSFENILRQVIAQHSIRLMDAIYDRLILTPLYATGDLEIEQSMSTTDPDDCSLHIQLSKSRRIQTKIDSVTGSFILSPATDKTEKFQNELNRSKTLVDDFVSKILTFRCAIAEEDILQSMDGSSWQIQRGFNATQNEIKTLFGGYVVKINFFKQLHWSSGYALAITHSTNGDRWWLFLQGSAESSALSSISQIIHTESVHLQEDLSPSYFERFAEYISGMITLQSNAKYLNEKMVKFSLPIMPTFGSNYNLPTLSFDLESAPSIRSTNDNQVQGQSLTSQTVQVRYMGYDRNSSEAILSARISGSASTQALKLLKSSNSDSDVVISPQMKQITVRFSSMVGTSIISDIIQRLSHLQNIITCVEKVNHFSGLELKSLSSSAVTILYRKSPPVDLTMVLYFATLTEPAKLEFLPSNDNPHVYLTPHLTRILHNNARSFAANLTYLLATLNNTYSLISFLHKLQKDNVVVDNSADSVPPSNVRLHVLARQSTMLGVQYFLGGNQQDGVGQDISSRMLARLEILPQIYQRKNLWLIRPAIEELNSYQRPSFSSQALRTLLREEIFARREGKQDWLRLDSAAACLTTNPEILLTAIHTLITNWAKESQSQSLSSTAPTNSENKTNKNTNAVNGVNHARPQKSSRPDSKVNGVNQQRLSQNASKQTPMKNNQEIITVD